MAPCTFPSVKLYPVKLRVSRNSVCILGNISIMSTSRYNLIYSLGKFWMTFYHIGQDVNYHCLQWALNVWMDIYWPYWHSCNMGMTWSTILDGQIIFFWQSLDENKESTGPESGFEFGHHLSKILSNLGTFEC